MFVEGGQIFATIDQMVDRIFNRFVRREGHLEPYFTEYCDGRRSQCPGLWQWTTVTLANQGLNALQILRRFYPNDVQIVETDNIGGVEESFPGFTLRPGMSGPEVRTMQNWLNRIRVNFPIIPQVTASGVYGPQTEAAVRAFQGIRTLGSVGPNGVVDRATWWNISRAYSAVKRLGELTSEGIVIGIGRTPPTDIIRQGARGNLVGRAQYVMNFISQFYPSVPTVVQDFNFGPNFTAAVQEFQRLFGLNPDGIIGPLTWGRLYDIYWRIRENVPLPPSEPVVPPLPPTPQPPPTPGPGGVPPYPGQLIRVGARGEDVQRIQRCLNAVNNASLATDGIFGPLTQAAVMDFQRSRGLSPDGIVGPLTWGALMPACYGGQQTMGSYPGFLIREGARSDYVRQIQTCLNRANNAGLNTDGIFGPLTRAAVESFQRSRGLNPDGIVGPLTWVALSAACGSTQQSAMGQYPGVLIRQGERNDYVRQIQTCLNRVNNAGIATDGIFGPLTHAAVVNYQTANMLVPDGIVGPMTWNHLRTRCGATAQPTALPVDALDLPQNEPETPVPETPPSENEVIDFFPLDFEGDMNKATPAPHVPEPQPVTPPVVVEQDYDHMQISSPQEEPPPAAPWQPTIQQIVPSSATPPPKRYALKTTPAPTRPGPQRAAIPPAPEPQNQQPVPPSMPLVPERDDLLLCMLVYLLCKR
ncbi:MAG: peptidoglycan-binding protein [Firmicutes bacterium]|nr:peptidoglycan-binding protein [Bacillota bacterium]